MATEIDPVPLPERARTSLAEALGALDRHTDAPLRVRAHAAGRGTDIFDLQEEFELGPRGRRFLLSVDARARETLLLSVGRDTEDDA